MQYIANTEIRHEGKTCMPGTVINLSSEEAKTLLASGDISPVDVPFSKKLNTPFGGK